MSPVRPKVHTATAGQRARPHARGIGDTSRSGRAVGRFSTRVPPCWESTARLAQPPREAPADATGTLPLVGCRYVRRERTPCGTCAGPGRPRVSWRHELRPRPAEPDPAAEEAPLRLPQRLLVLI